MRKPPCGKCERKGCGSFHDECEAYQEWKDECKKSKAPREEHREFIKQSTFKSRTSGQFRNHKK